MSSKGWAILGTLVGLALVLGAAVVLYWLGGEDLATSLVALVAGLGGVAIKAGGVWPKGEAKPKQGKALPPSVFISLVALALGGCGLLKDMTPEQREVLTASSQAAATAGLDALAGELEAIPDDGPAAAATVRACMPLVNEALAEGIMGNPCAVELARGAVLCVVGGLDAFGLAEAAVKARLWGRALVADVALVAVMVGRADLALCGGDD